MKFAIPTSQKLERSARSNPVARKFPEPPFHELLTPLPPQLLDSCHSSPTSTPRPVLCDRFLVGNGLRRSSHSTGFQQHCPALPQASTRIGEPGDRELERRKTPTLAVEPHVLPLEVQVPDFRLE